MNKLTDNVRSLSLITSCGCNLKCDYCYINKSVNTESSLIQKNTIKALQDGSFFENVKKVLRKLEISPNKITNMSFWGQEPTLTLKYLNPNLEKILPFFPKLDNFQICSNGMGFVEDLINFIKNIDQNLQPDSGYINLQFSYDGLYSNEHFRHANSETIRKNIETFVIALNQIKLKKLKVEIIFHAVLSFDLMRKLQTLEDIEKYYLHFDEFANYFHTLNINKNVNIVPDVGIALEVPVDVSQEDAMMLATFVKKAQRIPKNKYLFGDTKRLSILGPTNFYHEILDRFNFNSIYELMLAITKDENLYKEALKVFSQILYCANGYGELKIMYDGTLINCQNSIYEQDANNIDPEKNIMNEVKRSLANHKYFINPLNATDEEIENYFDLFKVEKESCFYFMFSQVQTLIYYLAKAKQIDEKYLLNEKLFIESSYIIATMFCCAYNNLIRNGSAFIRDASIVREYCNGYLAVGMEENY